ncbi:MAG: chorismate mutase [Acetobacteraceae bacterium]|nr:chorismate mutase [Acetobacteraceae bacterium]
MTADPPPAGHALAAPDPPPPEVPQPDPLPPDLALLRADIDRLDDALHDLVMQRAAVVERLSQSRAKGTGPAVRPGREAIILRRLLARHQGPFPPSALVQVWRALINGHTAMQGPFGIAVFNTAPGSGYLALTREHFGATTPARSLTTPAQVLAAVSSGEAALGVLPMPESEGEAGTWWTALLARDVPRVHIVGRLPFWTPRAEGGPRVEALVVGVMAPEATGADRTLLVTETATELSRARLQAALDESGLVPGAMLLRRSIAAVSLLLIEVEGFCDDDDPRLAGFARRAGATRPVVAGAYAVPLDEAGQP